MPSNQITPQQISQYHEHGFVLIGSIMDEATLHDLRQEEARIRQLPFVKEDGSIEPDGLTIFRSQLCDYSEPVRRFVTGGSHLAVARQLVSQNICLWFNQFVTKLPDDPAGKLAEFPWHQDNGYGNIEPATNITIWCALDDVNERNGCVWVMPGSHKSGVAPHRPSAGSWHFVAEAEGDGIPAILKAGEAIAFSGLTLHRSKQNHTPQPRRAFFMEYADAAAVSGPERTPVMHSRHSWMVAGEKHWPTPVQAAP